MTGGEVAGILVAVFWAILVSFLAVALARLAQTLRATTKLVADVTEQAVPLLAEASATVRSAQTQLDRVDAIASDVQEVTSNASALSTTVASTFGGPLVKVAAFGYGVRRALGRSRDGRAPRLRAPHCDRRPYRAVRATAEAEGLSRDVPPHVLVHGRRSRRRVGHQQGQPEAEAVDPESLAAQAANKAVEAGHRLKDFALDVRAGMVQREAELGRRSDSTPPPTRPPHRAGSFRNPAAGPSSVPPHLPTSPRLRVRTTGMRTTDGVG